jgi:hypothetical protein
MKTSILSILLLGCGHEFDNMIDLKGSESVELSGFYSQFGDTSEVTDWEAFETRGMTIPAPKAGGYFYVVFEDYLYYPTEDARCEYRISYNGSQCLYHDFTQSFRLGHGETVLTKIKAKCPKFSSDGSIDIRLEARARSTIPGQSDDSIMYCIAGNPEAEQADIVGYIGADYVVNDPYLLTQ